MFAQKIEKSTCRVAETKLHGLMSGRTRAASVLHAVHTRSTPPCGRCTALTHTTDRMYPGELHDN